MSRRAITGLLTLLLGAILAAVWFSTSGGGEVVARPDHPRPGGAVEASGTGAQPSALAANAPRHGDDGDPATLGRQSAGEAEPISGVLAARGKWWRRPTAAQWISGRVEFPPGAPLDEEVYVEAEGSTFPTDPEGRRKFISKVDRDGFFRVAFAPKTQYGRLQVIGRFLYLEERLKVELSNPESYADLRLQPSLGGLALARVLPPRHAAFSDNPLAGVAVSGARGGPFGRSAKDGYTTDRPGEWEVWGLAPGEGYTIGATSPLWADGETSEVKITEGQVTVVDVALSVGVRLSGQVLDELGGRVAGGEVMVMTAAQAARRNPFMTNDKASRTEALDGTFELKGVPPGELVLIVEAGGYLESELELGELLDGAERYELTVRLDSGGKISGVVRWPGGEPAEGARVRVAQGGSLGGGAMQIERVKGEIDVGPDGFFAFSGLEPGKACSVTASAIHPDDQPDPNSRVSMLLAKRIPRWVASEMEVQPSGTALVLELSPGDILEGKVVDDQGEPVTNFAVLASPAGSTIFTSSSRRPVRGRFRDEEGHFVLKGVQPGEWEVKVGAPGHADSPRRLLAVPHGGELSFAVARSGAVHGLVLDKDGEPANKVRVMVEHSGGTAAASTDAEGLFEVGKVSPGEIILVADSEDAAQSERETTRLGAGETRKGIILRLRPGASIVVELHPEAGEREGRRVTLSKRDNGDGSRNLGMMGGRGRSSGKTDGEGVVVFEGLDPGTYDLELAPDPSRDFGEGANARWLSFANREKARVEVAAGQVAQVTLGGPSPSQVKVSGSVTAQGEPVPGALITAMLLDDGEERPSVAVTADGSGEYELKLRDAGKWRFSVQADGEWTAVVLDVPRVAEYEYEFRLPEARLVGLLTGPDGSPLPEMQLSLVEKESDGIRNNFFAQRRTATDEQGRFEFKHLQPGTYHLRSGGTEFGGFGFFEEKGQEFGRVIVVIEVVSDNETIERDVQLPGAGKLHGTVSNVTGQWISGARIRVTDEEGRPLSQFEMVRSGPDGSYEYVGLAPGTYLVSARRGSGEDELVAQPRTVKVYEGGRTEVLLVLE
jgi:hypothetical protein